MCTVIDEARVMVCDVSRDRVTESVRAFVGDAVSVETVHYEGTLFTCDDEARVEEFQRAVIAALGWGDTAFVRGSQNSMPR
jgi:hypothetical protein